MFYIPFMVKGKLRLLSGGKVVIQLKVKLKTKSNWLELFLKTFEQPKTFLQPLLRSSFLQFVHWLSRTVDCEIGRK